MTDDQYSFENYFQQIYIINLKRRPDRLESIKKRLSRQNIQKYQIIEAVDGQNPDIIKYYNWKSRNHHFFESAGALGVLLSALKILKDAWEKKYERFLILEDDVVFTHNFQNDFTKRIKTIPDRWKLLYFGTSIHKWRFNQRVVLNKQNQYFQTQGEIAGAFAVGISRDVIPYLIREIPITNKAWDTGVLSNYNRIKQSDVFIFYPYLIVCNTQDSDLRRKKSLVEKVETSRWNLSLYDW